MTHRTRGPGRRPAFTLIELLVVIAIIAILISLTAAAVVHFLTKGPETLARSEIGEFDTKLSSLKSQFNLKYLPSRLHLSKTNAYGNNQLDNDSKAFLQVRFGRDCCAKFAPLPSTPGQFIDWNGDGVAPEEIYLAGEQVLVFLLGGVPQIGATTVGMTGFSNNVTNPAQAGGTRQGPFFEFQPARLAWVTTAPGNGKFPVYIDEYNTKPTPQPYLFFSGYGQEGGGGYNKYGGPDTNIAGVQPYFTQAGPPAVFANAGSWQIISAGADGKFGPGGLWNPATGYSGAGPGADDQSNFSPRKLGAPAN